MHRSNSLPLSPLTSPRLGSPKLSPRLGGSPRFTSSPRLDSQPFTPYTDSDSIPLLEAHERVGSPLLLNHYTPPSRWRPSLGLFALALVTVLVFISVKEHERVANWGGPSVQSLKDTLFGAKGGLPLSGGLGTGGEGEQGAVPDVQVPTELPDVQEPAKFPEAYEAVEPQEEAPRPIEVPTRPVEPPAREDGLVEFEPIDEVESAPPPPPPPPPPPAQVVAELKPCERTMMFRFASRHGFGSEFAILLRAAVLARHYNYTLLLDSSVWNYGPWTSYFKPLDLSCIPPSEKKLKRAAMHTSHEELDAKSPAPAWTESAHVAWQRDIDGLDALLLNLFTDSRLVAELHEADLQNVVQAPLSAEATIPGPFWKVFRVLAETLKELWRPNEEMERLTRELEVRLGVRPNGEVEIGSDGDAVTVAMHVRLGDKYLEVDHIGPASSDKGSHRTAGPGLHSDALTTYLTAATSTIQRILTKENSDDVPAAGAHAGWKGRPTLAVMSDDPEAWREFARDDRAEYMRVVGTTGEGDGRWMVKRAETTDKPLKDHGGFHETAFNKLPLEQRISLTRTFVRDVTVLSLLSDGLVMSGSSNVGRLMALLMGEEKALKLGRVQSVDTRWFPTARFQ